MEDSPVPGKRAWALSREAFDQLLSRLDPDRDRAGEAYELIRHKLTKFFEWRGAPFPDELADETIDRTARRLAEGTEVGADKLHAYFRGIAVKVLQESWRRPGAQAVVLSAPPPRVPEQVLERLEQALHSLTPADRDLTESYYRGSDLKRARRDLAKRLHLSPNVIRIRACRARRKLEAYFKGYEPGTRS